MPIYGSRPILPVYVTPPAESSLTEVIEEIDRQLRSLALIPAPARTPVQRSKADVLLDRRNRLTSARGVMSPELRTVLLLLGVILIVAFWTGGSNDKR